MRRGFAVVLWACLLPGIAGAWGLEGHRVTGRIAEALLVPAARARLAALLPGADLAEATVYLDRHKEALAKRPGLERSREWHYDDIPVCGVPSDGHRCPDGHCASVQLDRHTRRLSPDLPPEVRAEAVRVVVHILGDMHQPLHAADHADRGGNDLWVRLPGQDAPARLHFVWDVVLVREAMQGRSEAEFARALVDAHRDRLDELARGDPSGWLQESHVLAAEAVYGGLPGFACEGDPVAQPVDLQAPYMAQGEALVRLQLVRAGARIARVLNEALGR